MTVMSKWFPLLSLLLLSPHNHFSYFRCDSQKWGDMLGTPYYCGSWNELLSSLVMPGRVKNIIKGWKNRVKAYLSVVYVSGGPPLSSSAKELLSFKFSWFLHSLCRNLVLTEFTCDSWNICMAPISPYEWLSIEKRGDWKKSSKNTPLLDALPLKVAR